MGVVSIVEVFQPSKLVTRVRAPYSAFDMNYKQTQGIILIGTALVFAIGIMYCIGWSDHLSNNYKDTSCRKCAQENNLTCIEEINSDSYNLYLALSNISETRLNCEDSAYVYKDCKMCLREHI